MNLPKTDNNNRTYKKDANMQSWYMVNTSFWTSDTYEQISYLVFNLEDPVLVQTLSYRRKITYHPLPIGFFHKLI